MKNSFYEIKNFIPQKSADLYIYGQIVTDDINWWTEEKDENLVGLQNFKKEIDELGEISDLNIYLNTPGGEVFVASTMCSMLQRLKDKGTKIHTFVDGLCASAGTFILMMGDDINLYQNSVIMIHKPTLSCYGNVFDFQKGIDILNTIEKSTMLPLYMTKAKRTEDEIKEKINNESRMGAEETQKYFDVNILENENQAVACVDKEIFKKYKNIPENIKNLLDKHQKIDYLAFEERLKKLK